MSREFPLCLLLSSAALFVAVLFAVLYFRQKRRIHRLNKRINVYLTSGEEIPLSVTDDMLGHLQTNICELQHRLKQEMLCSNSLLPCGENHYGFFKCPTSLCSQPFVEEMLDVLRKETESV